MSTYPILKSSNLPKIQLSVFHYQNSRIYAISSRQHNLYNYISPSLQLSLQTEEATVSPGGLLHDQSVAYFIRALHIPYMVTVTFSVFAHSALAQYTTYANKASDVKPCKGRAPVEGTACPYIATLKLPRRDIIEGRLPTNTSSTGCAAHVQTKPCKDHTCPCEDRSHKHPPSGILPSSTSATPYDSWQYHPAQQHTPTCAPILDDREGLQRTCFPYHKAPSRCKQSVHTLQTQATCHPPSQGNVVGSHSSDRESLPHGSA